MEPPWDELTGDDVREAVCLLWNLKVPPSDRWSESGAHPMQRVRDWHQQWADDQQAHIDVAWRKTDAFALAVLAEAQAVRERQEEAARDRADAMRRQQRADEAFTYLVENGLTPREAQRIVSQQFPGTS